MKIIRVLYHPEDENWWAESEDLPGWTAAGATFEEVRKLAHEGAAEFAGTAVAIEEIGVPMQLAFKPAEHNIQTFTGTILNQISGVDVRWLPDTQGGVVPALPSRT